MQVPASLHTCSHYMFPCTTQLRNRPRWVRKASAIDSAKLGWDAALQGDASDATFALHRVPRTWSWAWSGPDFSQQNRPHRFLEGWDGISTSISWRRGDGLVYRAELLEEKLLLAMTCPHKARS